MSKIIIGVVGPGREARSEDVKNAHELGTLIALEGWVVLSGGRDVGVMDAVSRGAKQANGLTIGILPTEDAAGMSTAIDIPIITGMGQARNNINILSSEVIIACGIGAGTASEIALAIKANKRIILLGFDKASAAFFKELGRDRIFVAEDPQQAVELTKKVART